MRKLIVCIFCFLANYTAFAQKINWTPTSTSIGGKVVIPTTVSLGLPTNGSYKIGFFVKKGDSLRCVGASNWVSGNKLIINLNTDITGVNGYKSGDRLVSLMLDNGSLKTYGVEFAFENNKNTFVENDSNLVTKVFSNTWSTSLLQNGNYCQSMGKLPLSIPYGVNVYFLFSSGFLVDSSASDNLKRIIFNGMQPAKAYTVKVVSHTVSFNTLNYTFNIIHFPIDSLYKTYEICAGSSIKIASNDTLLKTFSGNLNQKYFNEAGKYPFITKYLTNGCTSTDTLEIKYKTDCPPVKTQQTISFSKGDYLPFSKNEIIKIYNSEFEFVTQFQAPALWKGVNSNGELLQGGLYFVVHEDDTQETVTIYQ